MFGIFRGTLDFGIFLFRAGTKKFLYGHFASSARQSFLEKRFLELLERVVVCVVLGQFGFFRPQSFGQVFGANIGRHTKCNSSFDRIFEFADVSRPTVRDQKMKGFGANSHDRRKRMRTDLAIIFHEVRRKRDILAVLGKARHFDGKDIQAEEQILTKAAVFDGFLKIAICGGNNADIHLDQSVSADAFELSVLWSCRKRWR